MTTPNTHNRKKLNIMTTLKRRVRAFTRRQTNPTPIRRGDLVTAFCNEYIAARAAGDEDRMTTIVILTHAINPLTLEVTA